MNNRFGFKDAVIVALLGVVLLVVILMMVQVDRQWDKLQQVSDKIDRMSSVPAASTNAASHGTTGSEGTGLHTPPTVPVTPPGAIPGGDDNDPFARIRQAAAMPGFARGDWNVDAFGGGVAKLTPLLSGDVYASIVQDNVLESLATRDPETLAWRGYLAQSWRIEDNVSAWQKYVDREIAAGGKREEIILRKECPFALRIIFKMRPGVTFSDGQPLTADDVVFTFNFMMDKKINAPREKAYYAMVAQVAKIGADEVEFVYREPYFKAFEIAGSMSILPKHFYGALSPEEFNQSVGYLLGSGPYRLENARSWKPGSLIQMVRNERYWGVSPAFDRLVYKEITNDVARLTAFRNGEIDLFTAFPEQYQQMKNDPGIQSRANAFAYQSPLGGYRYVAWNQLRDGKPTIFADVRVRQALTMLLDRQRMVQELMLGYAVPATGPFNPASRQCDPKVQPWPYDPQRAKAMLAQAGLADRNGDGVLDDAQGQPFRFKLTYPSGNPNYEKMVLFIKDSFARGGVVVEPDPLEWSVFTERLNKKNFEAITLAWSAGIESDIYQMFHSSQMVEEGDDFVSYKNPRLDALIDQARRTIDEDARMAIWRQCHAILNEDQPYTFLFFPMSLRFVDKRIENVQLLKLGMNPREEWFVPRKQQRWTK